MKMLDKLDLLREVYDRQSKSSKYAREHGMKTMIRDVAQDVGDMIYGSGLDEVLDKNQFINFTLDHAKELSDSEIYTRLGIIQKSVQTQVSTLVPNFFQYDHGVFIVQQSPKGDIITSKWWEGGVVDFRELEDHH